ncbi:MAG: hypothetical protein AAGG45_04985 [Pseudomonadota bacterium]
MIGRAIVLGISALALSACGGENTPTEETEIDMRFIGTWTSTEDDQSAMTITETSVSFAYDGVSDGDEPYTVEQGCPSAPQVPFDGDTIVTRPDGGDVFCYAIDTREEDRLVLIYLPRGNTLEFVRAES